MIVLSFLFSLLLLAGIVGAVLYFTGVIGRRDSSGRIGLRLTRKEIRAYARRYRRRFPGTKPKSLREALRQEFLPERAGKLSADEQAAGCLLFGAGGMMAQAAMVHASDSEIDHIREMIEDVIEDVYAEDD